jgi:hypothetical protein
MLTDLTVVLSLAVVGSRGVFLGRPVDPADAGKWRVFGALGAGGGSEPPPWPCFGGRHCLLLTGDACLPVCFKRLGRGVRDRGGRLMAPTKRTPVPGEADKLIAHQSRLLKAPRIAGHYAGWPSKAVAWGGRWRTT